MLRRPRRALACALLLCVASRMAPAADYREFMANEFPLPDHYELMNDLDGMLLVQQRGRIREKLQALEKRNGTQIVFLSVPNTGKDGAYAYGQKAFAKWDIGNNGQGNGVLFIVGADEAHILTGPGIAGAIPDVTAHRIYRDILLPAAQRDQLAEGVEASIDALIKASHDEETHATAYDYANPYVPRTPQQIAAWVLAGVAVAYAASVLWLRRRKGGKGGKGGA